MTHKLISRIDEKIKEDRRFTIDGLTSFFLEILHLVLYKIVGSYLALQFDHTPKSIRNFVNSYFENTQALQGLNTDITDRNPLFSATILRKMDSELRKHFEHFLSLVHSDHANNHGSDDS